MEESYSCPDCTFTANRDLVLQVLRHFFNCTSFRCIQDISCGHNLGPSTPSPQTQGKNNNKQNNSCYGDVSTKETAALPVHSEFSTAKVYSENTDRLCSPHSDTTSNSRATNDFTFQPDNRSNIRENTSIKEASPLALLSHESEEMLHEQLNTDSIENMQSETDRTSQDTPALPWRIESYRSIKPHHSVLSVTPPSSTSGNITLQKTDYESAAVSAQNLRTAKLHDPVPTDTARSDTQVQVQVKVEPDSDEYGDYNTGFQKDSSTQGMYRQSSLLTAVPAVPPVVDNSCRDSMQQLRRDTVNTDAPTSAAGEGVSANSQELRNGQQVQWPLATPLVRCPVCSTPWKDRRALTKHCSHDHPQHPCCTICCTIFNSRQELHKHQKTLHKGKIFQCWECNKTFGYKRNLQVHMKEQHLEVGQLFPCKVCQRVYKSRRVLKEHQRKHTNCRQYICDICGKCLKAMSSLRSHYLHIHHRYY
ncbi:uncharacterized protein LOC144925066 isoform X2 [Branchiostoma floridae x Branchiostoma belcheri]